MTESDRDKMPAWVSKLLFAVVVLGVLVALFVNAQGDVSDAKQHGRDCAQYFINHGVSDSGC